MEHAIEEPGKHLAALHHFIAVELPVILKKSSSPDTLPAKMDALTYQVHQEVYKGHLAHADAPAHTRYLALRQLNLLELVGHLLEHTQPIQLYRTLSHRTPTDDICRHLYGRLESVLQYTVEKLADGQIDPGLTLPPATCMLYQHMLGSDLGALRDRFVALHISPRLIDMVLLPFEKLRREDYITYHTAVYLRDLKQQLLALAGGDQQSPGDGDMLALLVAHNFNEPAFVAYYHQVIEGQLETRTSPEDRLAGLRDYRSRLAHPAYSTRLAWHHDQPSVRQQLMKWLDETLAVPAVPANNTVSAPDSEPAEEYDDTSSADEFMLYMHPVIFGAIANAAHQRKIIHLGHTDQQRAEQLSRIPSSVKRVAPGTIRRGFTEVEVCRKGLVYVDNIGEQLRDTIKKFENK
jgi:hypothetical protein